MNHQTGSSALTQALAGLDAEQLRGMRRGLEKESLRVRANGALALTPHPAALGSALTHPHITTDFCESQLELVTAAHGSPEAVLQELRLLHQFTYRVLAREGDEMLWVSSMPCGLPTDETIPIARYGSSNVGRAKSVYRMGLSHRYGRRMQTISGIHYNWSLPGLSNAQYFSLIRNFRRHAFLLLYLFGASPAVCSSFVAGRQHELLPLDGPTMHMPYGTSLRMGRLGYQSDAQASLAVSYNSLEGYAAALHEALSRSYPAYEAVGLRNPGGDYNQLATTLLQIENEFYGTIRPKRVIFPGERPLHALRERGVEYVEVRLMDLNPFEPLGIDTATMRFLDVFLLHCLLSSSPPDTPQEIAALARNQHRTAARGREPGLQLERDGKDIGLLEWGTQLLADFDPIARRLDQDLLGTAQEGAYAQALAQAHERLAQPDDLPSARVLEAMVREHGRSFTAFARDRSARTRLLMLEQGMSQVDEQRLQQMSIDSVREQQRIESLDSLPFEIYRQQYTSPERLGRPRAVMD
ncbi:MAG: glutamate--cysteine ligase [Betaproteobacteria bacterium]